MKSERFAVTILALLIGCAIFQSGTATAADRVTLQGTVTYQGSPVCAMVLVNGQYMFSCGAGDDFGKYELSVPPDANDLLTIQVFVSGLAPFRQVTDTYDLTFDVAMQASDPGSQSPDVTTAVDPDDVSPAGWVRISGTVNFAGEPLCAMVLANGQYMFSCGANNGVYDLTVPLDGKGQITHYVFVSGKQPYKRVFTPKIDDPTVCFADQNWTLRTKWENQPEFADFGACSIRINSDGTLTAEDDNCVFSDLKTGMWTLFEYQDDGSLHLSWRWDAYPGIFYQAPVSPSNPCTVDAGTMHNLDANESSNEGRWYLEAP